MTAASPTRWFSRVLLFAALALFVAQSLPSTLAAPLTIDETVSYYLVAGSPPERLIDRALSQSATPPLYFWLAQASHWAGGRLTDQAAEWWLRAPAWVSMLAALCVAYLLAERWIAPGTGGAAALLLAANEPLVHFSTQARPYTLGLLESLLAAALLIRLRAPGWKLWQAAAFVALNAALVWTHYLFALLLVAELLMAPFVRLSNVDEHPLGRPPLAVRRLAGLLLVSAAALLPAAPGVLRLFEVRDNLDWAAEIPPWYESTQFFGRLPALAAVFGVALLIGVFRHGRLRRPGEETPADARLPGWGFMIWYLVPVVILQAVGQLYATSVAQLRYALLAAAPAVLLTVWLLTPLVGPRLVGLFAIALFVLNGAPQQILARILAPDAGGTAWKRAALTLNDSASAGDLVFVYSGLVETRFQPALYQDPGYQAYVTCRLCPLYLTVPVEKRSLPGFWMPGEWQSAYGRIIDERCRSGAQVWLVIAADTDLGQRCQQRAEHWLGSRGMSLKVVRKNAQARVLRAECPRATPSDGGAQRLK